MSPENEEEEEEVSSRKSRRKKKQQRDNLDIYPFFCIANSFRIEMDVIHYFSPVFSDKKDFYNI